MGLEELERRWKEPQQKTNYSAAYDRWNDLCNWIRPLCEAAMECKANTLAGAGAQAAAAIVQEEDFDLDCYPNSGAVLVALARAAGFEVA
jgi:hypothetical protein